MYFFYFRVYFVAYSVYSPPMGRSPRRSSVKNIAAGSGVSVETTAQHRQCSSICLSAAMPTDAALSL